MITLTLDRMLAKRRLSLVELSDRTGIPEPHLKLLREQDAVALRLSTLDTLCKVLDCQPADLMTYTADDSAP